MRALNWKVIFLAMLILSSVAAIYTIVTLDTIVLETPRTDLPKFYLDVPILLEPIDDEPGG